MKRFFIWSLAVVGVFCLSLSSLRAQSFSPQPNVNPIITRPMPGENYHLIYPTLKRILEENKKRNEAANKKWGSPFPSTNVPKYSPVFVPVKGKYPTFPQQNSCPGCSFFRPQQRSNDFLNRQNIYGQFHGNLAPKQTPVAPK